MSEFKVGDKVRTHRFKTGMFGETHVRFARPMGRLVGQEGEVTEVWRNTLTVQHRGSECDWVWPASVCTLVERPIPVEECLKDKFPEEAKAHIPVCCSSCQKVIANECYHSGQHGRLCLSCFDECPCSECAKTEGEALPEKREAPAPERKCQVCWDTGKVVGYGQPYDCPRCNWQTKPELEPEGPVLTYDQHLASLGYQSRPESDIYGTNNRINEALELGNAREHLAYLERQAPRKTRAQLIEELGERK